MQEKDNEVLNQATSGKDFIKELAKYFMDFLETDFHRRRAPKRSVRYRNSDNLLVGLNLKKYPSFFSVIQKTIANSFDEKSLAGVSKGVYKADIPKNLLDVINLQIKQINKEHIDTVNNKIAKEVQRLGELHKDNYAKASTLAIDFASHCIKEDLVLSFVKSIEKSLEEMDLGDENNIYLMEEGLSDVLAESVHLQISEAIKNLSSGADFNAKLFEAKSMSLKGFQSMTQAFFQDFKIEDLFAEVYEMERNKGILDKQEFYLYFCDITYNKNKYPIFYIPIALIRENEKIRFEFDAQVYINKRAIDFIVQEFNEETGGRGKLSGTSERIIYLSQEQKFPELINSILSELVNFFELDKSIDITKTESQESRGMWAGISNNIYFALFDKSDEALINDWEDILESVENESGEVAEAFTALIDNFIFHNPEPYNSEVEDEWDDTSTSNKLVPRSPIPLNSEQIQILSALKRDGCKYITVQGPPGTGKSHTITAVVFDAILNDKSVLVLSDKKEALDVVEDKITETMNKVRHDKSFQNPILRLGKTGNTYAKILATNTIDNIKAHYRTVRQNYELLEENINKTEKTLKEDIEAEILTNQDINLQELSELTTLETWATSEDRFSFINFKEVLNASNDLNLVEVIGLVNKYSKADITDSVELNISMSEIANNPESILTEILNFKKVLNELETKFRISAESVTPFRHISWEQLDILDRYANSLIELKKPIIGYLLAKSSIAKIKQSIIDIAPAYQFSNAQDFIEIVTMLKKVKGESELLLNGNRNFLVDSVLKLLFNSELENQLHKLSEIAEDFVFLHKAFNQLQTTFNSAGLNVKDPQSFVTNKFRTLSDEEFIRLNRYFILLRTIRSKFNQIPLVNYSEIKKNLEDFVTTQMTYIMDGRLIKFYEHNRTDARTLRDIIRKKKKFPKDDFIKLKEAFPCILAGIRDYAEYIPLQAGIFDLVIIDEASQVSIAQALPALLRAKQVLILGDRKQFSNVKSSQARTDTNIEYVNRLVQAFSSSVGKDISKLEKIDRFNIKTSILEFFEFISNYQTQLLKHFRGYKELISYSNKFFYQGSLQAMKIRGKSIEETLEFSVVEHDGKEEIYDKANTIEAEYIISELLRRKEGKINETVGIITPHTNQQKLLTELISKLPEKDYFEEEFNLKIMTFDTCQGEERDVIYFSMVATATNDKLSGVFIKDLNDVDVEEDSKIRAQRLNVGFSRAKEKMHFVLSKPIEKFSGSIGEALRFYQHILHEAKKEKDVSLVDKNSAMEPYVLNWFYQTEFWNTYKDSIEFIPQFEIGSYLKQLDATYNHPEYKVDFLLNYSDVASTPFFRHSFYVSVSI